jgi:hypothetical protein
MKCAEYVEFSGNRKMLYTFCYSVLFYVMFHTMFYTLEQIHYNFCTPYGISGFIQSFFTSRSTICYALKTVSWHTSNASSNMMYVIISLLGGYFTTTATSGGGNIKLINPVPVSGIDDIV